MEGQNGSADHGGERELFDDPTAFEGTGSNLGQPSKGDSGEQAYPGTTNPDPIFRKRSTQNSSEGYDRATRRDALVRAAIHLQGSVDTEIEWLAGGGHGSPGFGNADELFFGISLEEEEAVWSSGVESDGQDGQPVRFSRSHSTVPDRVSGPLAGQAMGGESDRVCGGPGDLTAPAGAMKESHGVLWDPEEQRQMRRLRFVYQGDNEKRLKVVAAIAEMKKKFSDLDLRVDHSTITRLWEQEHEEHEA